MWMKQYIDETKAYQIEEFEVKKYFKIVIKMLNRV
jgi:hypothetical protein